MELERYAKILWKWAWLIVLSAAVAGVSSYLVTRSTPRIYQTKTTVMVCEIAGINSTELYLCQQRAQAYAQLARREPVINGALTELGLAETMDWRTVAKGVTTNLVPGTQLMEIFVNDTYPERARALADAMAAQLIVQSTVTDDPDEQDRAFIDQQLADLEVKIDDAREEIKGLQAELDEAISARRIQDLENEIAVLESKISGWQSTYAQLRASLQSREASQLKVVEPATVPTTPIAPNVPANLLLAVAIGATVAGGAAFLLDYLDDTIKTSRDVERITSLSTLGYIAPDDQNRHDEMPMAVRSPSALVVENYRALSTSIQLSSGMLSKLGRRGGDKLGRTLIVTSAGPFEGKSTTATNLAVVMAQSGMVTILVDADLRRPVVRRTFGLENQGLAETVEKMRLMKDEEASAAAALSYLQPSGIENLRVLTSGTPPGNPAELLGSNQMEQLIHILERNADIVLFDTPPILAVTDAILLVVQSGSTRRPMLQRAMEALEPLEKTGTPTLGVVLNRAPSSAGGYYYYDRYSSDGREPGKGNGKRGTKKRVGRVDAEPESAAQTGTGEPESPTSSLS
jgi:succinoglycan biosynthesis transport protein ExoP